MAEHKLQSADLQKQKTVRIIGAGPAGLFAAEQIAAAGHKVFLHERMPSAGRKFLMAGRGGLNLTHSEPLADFLQRYPNLPSILKNAIHAFPPDALRSWADGLGAQSFVGTSGRVFPRAMKASPLLRAWLKRLGTQGVELATGQRLQRIEEDRLIFSSRVGAIAVPRADALLLACGGASWPGLGSDGLWTGVLAEHHVETKPFQPSNMGIKIDWTDRFRDEFAGQPLKSVLFRFGGQAKLGEAVVTRQGIEGGAIYALSAFMRETLLAEKQTLLSIDLKPGSSGDELARRLENASASESLSNRLRKRARLDRLQIALLHEQALLRREALPREPTALARLIKAVELPVHGTQGLERAISSAGGVPFSELNGDFGLHRMPGVFVAGEMLDWEAPTGGYLLQACFATGFAAAKGIIRFLSESAVQTD
jgi:uncharacterized flavoprotein (TIGR03862 family)